MKRMIGKHSGMWESREPCGLQNHPPESSAGGRGRPSAAASNFIPCQGSASSTVHLRSLSELSFSVPSTCTAHCRPGSQTGEGYVFRPLHPHQRADDRHANLGRVHGPGRPEVQDTSLAVQVPLAGTFELGQQWVVKRSR